MTAARSQTCATTGRSWVTSTRARPSSLDSRVSRSRIWACTMTSSAVVGSSASRIFGSQASAIAIAARCRMPPENSCGYRSPAAAGMPTSSSSSPARRRAAAPWATPWKAIGSAICQPTFLTGFSAFIAPWKTIATSVQRCARTESSPPARMLRPFTSTSPASVAVGGSRPISASTVVVLPQPDSPTRPNRSPSSSAKLTPAAACTCDAACGRSNQTCRSRTSSRLKSRPAPFRPAGAAASGAPTGGPPSAAG